MERMFAPAIAPTDPDFFVRRRMSYKLMRDDIAADPAAAAWQGASRRLSHARAPRRRPHGIRYPPATQGLSSGPSPTMSCDAAISSWRATT